MRQQWFTHVRLPAAHLTHSPAGLLTATLTTPALYRRSLRWFGLPTCIGEPGGPASITGTARFVLATFYIASLPFQDTHQIGGSCAVTATGNYDAI